MEPTQLNLRMLIKIIKIMLPTLKQILKMLETLVFPDDDDNVDPTKDLIHFTAVTARKTVERPQLDYFDAKLAVTLRDAANQMPSSEYPNCRAAREQCRQVITNLLGPDADKWRVFSNKIDEAMDALAGQGKLNDLAAYRQAYRDIAEGILKA